jgi:repressor LexA
MVSKSSGRNTKKPTSPQNSDLTESQEQILAYIKHCYERTGLPPSYREIQDHFGYKAIGTVQDHLKALRKKGALEEMPLGNGRRQARGLVPAGYKPEGTRRIPVFGEIAAGSTRDNAQLQMGTVVVADTVAKDPCFALRVVGDSMIEMGILEGDFLIVERKASIRSGDIVVALVNGETTVKRFVRKPDGIYLVPENRRLSPLKITTERFEVQGKVVGLQRQI